MFLANENFPRPSIELLRKHAYTIVSIQELMPGVSDETVLKKALDENLIILTFDKDYGELSFKYAQPNPPSIIYFREKGTNPLFAGQLLLKLLQNEQINVANAFTVIDERNVRQRFYNR